MSPRHHTRDLILLYLQVDERPVHIVGLLDYMYAQGVREGAVRSQLIRLEHDGMIERVERGRYKIRAAA